MMVDMALMGAGMGMVMIVLLITIALLIVFGQGAIRAHPFLLEEMNALAEDDRERGLDAFDYVFWKHIGHSFTTLFRAWGRSWTFGLFAPAPEAGDAARFYRQLSRYSASFALCADMALLTLGGALKRRLSPSGNDHGVSTVVKAMRQRFADTRPSAGDQNRVVGRLQARCSIRMVKAM